MGPTLWLTTISVKVGSLKKKKKEKNRQLGKFGEKKTNGETQSKWIHIHVLGKKWSVLTLVATYTHMDNHFFLKLIDHSYIFIHKHTRYVCIHSAFSCAKTYQKGRHEISWGHQPMPQGAVAAPGRSLFCRSGCVSLGGSLPLCASTSHWRPGAEQSPLPGAAMRTLLNPQTACMRAGSLVVWP